MRPCPQCGRPCPANEMAAYGRHEDCAMNEATASASRRVPSEMMAKRGPYKKRNPQQPRKPQRPKAESEE